MILTLTIDDKHLPGIARRVTDAQLMKLGQRVASASPEKRAQVLPAFDAVLNS